MINCFHRGFGTFQSFIKFKRKDMRIIKCRKVKFGPYQVFHSAFFPFVGLIVCFFIYEDRFHVFLQPLLVPRSWMKKLRRADVSSHPSSWPSLMDPAQSPTSELQGMERAIIIRPLGSHQTIWQCNMWSSKSSSKVPPREHSCH